MKQKSTEVTIAGDTKFDVAGVGNWVASHIWIFLLIAFVGFVFFLFQKGGFAERFLEYRSRKEELDAKKLDDLRIISIAIRNKHERADPFLPFDDDIEGTL